jgi:hypothetical protein
MERAAVPSVALLMTFNVARMLQNNSNSGFQGVFESIYIHIQIPRVLILSHKSLSIFEIADCVSVLNGVLRGKWHVPHKSLFACFFLGYCMEKGKGRRMMREELFLVH